MSVSRLIIGEKGRCLPEHRRPTKEGSLSSFSVAVALTENDGSKGGEGHELLGCCRRRCAAPVEEEQEGRSPEKLERKLVAAVVLNEREKRAARSRGKAVAARLLRDSTTSEMGEVTGGDRGDFLRWVWSKQKNVKDGLRLQLGLVAVLVTIWKVRNSIIFEKKKMEVEKEFRNSQELAYLWISSRNSKFKMELNSWVLNPRRDM
ncbi:hypothetical protein LXL04_006362 [Taraxacum kok-saghyz]